MNLIFILNQLYFVGITIFFPFYYSKRFGLKGFNPFIITFLLTSPITLFKSFVGPLYMVECGLFNPYFNYAIFMSNIYASAGLIMTILILHTYSNHKWFYNVVIFNKPKWNVKRHKMQVAAFIFLFLFIISFVFLTKNYGFVNWLLNPRGGYQFGRTGNGVYFALSLLFLSTSFSLSILYCKKLSHVFPLTFLYLFFVWFLGSKGFLLDFFAFAIIVLWLRGFKKLNKLVLLGFPFIFLILLMNFGSMDIIEIVKYFDYYVNSTNFYEAFLTGQLDFYYGEISLSSLWGLVPRGLYPDKPFVYGITIINEYFFPGAAEATMTPAFGGPVAQYADFGVIGVILSSIFNWSRFFTLYCYFIIFTKCSYQKIIASPILLYAFIYTFSPRFLQFFVFPLSLIIFIVILKIISWTNKAIISR